ncbi:uncharacterized protein LOC135265647 [Tribolium castaneum]|uniref:uncharacterized protein LOC135265647 n=1 Tax=Tribolium castaneum TaxID=7070 RepID=UPI0030FE4871
MSKRLRKENRHSSGSDDDYEYHRRHSKTRDRSSSRDVERRHRHKQKSKGRSLGRHSSRERTSRRHRRRRSERSDVSALSEALLKGMGQLVQAQGKTVTESHHLVSVTSNLIAEFNPITDNVSDWLDSVDEYAEIYQWDEKTTIHLALNKLRGPAADWYRGLPSRIFAWLQWKEMLIQNFLPKRNLHKELENMMTCVPRIGQSLYEYAFKKLALINKLKLGITSHDKVNLIISSIPDEQVKFTIETAGISDPSVLATHLKMLDEQKGNKTSTISTPGPSRAANTGSAANFGPKQTKSSIQCYHCWNWGHLKKDCPSKQQKNTKRLLAIEPKHVNFIGQDDNENKFIKNIFLNGVEIKCFVDFGSECSLITRAAANSFALNQLKGMLEPDDREVVDVTEVRARMERHNDHYQAEQKQRFDSKRKPGHLYSEGDLVLIKITSTPATGVSHKLLPKWRGPFRITKVLGNDRYEVADIPGSCRSRLRYSGVAGVDNMRPWIYCE